MLRFVAPLLLVLSQSVSAADWISDLYREAPIKHGIPASVLWSMALQESRRKVDGEWVPWPWTVNFAGDGMYFDSKDEAVDFVMSKLESGAKPISLDLGLLQGNLHYNAKYIEKIGIAEFFEPEANVEFAANKLRKCVDGGRTLTECIGRYHNHREEVASNYRRRISLRMQGK